MSLTSIEGNIGAGKTTFLNILKESNIFKDKILFISEPLNTWLSTKDSDGKNILDKFYKELKEKQENQENKNENELDSNSDHGWIYKFQTFTYITKMTCLVDAVNNSDKKIIFSDRSIDTDRYVFEKMLYDDKMLSLLEHNMYLNWSNFFDKYITKTDKKQIIYLECDPHVAYDRIQKRGRVEEKNITIDYLTKLHYYHEEWMNEEIKRGSHIMKLDWNTDRSNEQLLKLVEEKVNEFINPISKY